MNFDAYLIVIQPDGFYATRFQYNQRGCTRVTLKNRAFCSPSAVLTYMKKYMKYSARKDALSVIAPVTVIPAVETKVNLDWRVLMVATDEANRGTPDPAWRTELWSDEKLNSELEAVHAYTQVSGSIEDMRNTYSAQVKEIVLPIHRAVLKEVQKMCALEILSNHHEVYSVYVDNNPAVTQPETQA